ncbi:hypothetical protein BTW07_14625 [Salinicola socius]|uniref:Uncharacterized protein n=1 Tax=Salinicola socius TaxID=404433 RepID=A0A1Q8SPI8_9GAMM|nr:hypothetical protein BTW07_14625 [Salinicola socius]
MSFLAHYHDEKSKGNFLRLVFIRPDEIGVSKPVVLETHLDSEILSSVAKLNLEQMDGLCNSSEVEDSHYRERIGIFGNTLVEFVGQQVEPREAFALLVKNWRKFFESYQRNLAVYLSGFAFHKAKREVAQAEIDVSSKLSKIVGDISGKLLSIPVSLAAIVAIPRSDNVIIGALVVIGLLLGGFIVSHVIRNQSSQLARVVHSKEMIFSSIEGRKDVYPEDLVADIDQIKAALDEDVERLKSLLVIFSWLCWLPFTVAMLVHLYFCFAWFC